MSKKSFLGFLYHPASQQILLQQKRDEPVPTWALLGNLHQFHPKDIVPVYDYIRKGVKCVISYGQVKDVKDFRPTKTHLFKWFTPKEIAKLPISPQTRQDITVGHRVIDSQLRRDAGEQTIG